MAAREIHRFTGCPVVHEDTPPAAPIPDLDNRDLVDRPGRDAESDLMVLGCLVGLSDLVVQAARRGPRERAEADLKPLVGSVRTGARPTDANPAGDVSAEHLGRRDCLEPRRYAVGAMARA